MTTAQKPDAIASICDDFREIIRDIGQHIAQGQQSEAQMASMRPGYGTGVYTHIGHQMRKMLALVTALSDAQSALESERQAHAAEVAALKLQLEVGPLYSTRLKARRYDWLRNEAHPDRDDTGLSVSEQDFNDWGKPFTRYLSGDALDAAIDQAIARGKT